MGRVAKGFYGGAAVAALCALQAFSGPAQAQQAYSLTIHENGFQPSTLQVPAGVKVKLTVTNATAKSAEFESSELNREKVVPAGSSAIVYIGPLAAGSYPFFDDFDAKKRGQIVAK